MEHIIDDMYHGASNLGQRLAHELEQEQEVIYLLINKYSIIHCASVVLC